MVRQDTWLARTGQVWKVQLGSALTIIAGFVLLVSINRSVAGKGGDRELLVALGATVCGLAAFTWMLLSVRCHTCGTRVAWYRIQSSGLFSWLTELRRSCACPVCDSRT